MNRPKTLSKTHFFFPTEVAVIHENGVKYDLICRKDSFLDSLGLELILVIWAAVSS